MRTLDLYHGADGDKILEIMKSRTMKPSNGELYFVKHESQLHTCFVHGADSTRGSAFVVKVRCDIPDSASLKPEVRPGNLDTWILKTAVPISVEVLKLFVRRRPGQPVEIVEGREKIEACLRRKEFRILIKRKHSFAAGIVGELFANGKFICYTLELAWLWNQKDRSCVPPGKYAGFLRHDHKDKWRVELCGVPGDRQHVQIHIGNYPRDIKGCVLVGTSYGPDAVWHSSAAYEKLKDAYEYAHGPISVEFAGILVTPWGDYRRVRTNVA